MYYVTPQKRTIPKPPVRPIILALSLVTTETTIIATDQKANAQTPVREPNTTAIPGAFLYSSDTNPFEANEQMRRIATEVFNSAPDDATRLGHLHARLRVGAREGLRFFEVSHPQTGREAFALRGGICGGLENASIAEILVMNSLGAHINGGAYIVRINLPRGQEEHGVPYVYVGSRRMIFDLQLDGLVERYSQDFSVLVDYPNFDAARASYHLDSGEYFRRNNDYSDALSAYAASIAAFPNSPFVLGQMAFAYQRIGDTPNSVVSLERAARLDSSAFGTQLPQAYRNLVIYYQQLADSAHNSGNWAGCISNLRAERDTITEHHVAPEAGIYPIARINSNMASCQDQMGSH